MREVNLNFIRIWPEKTIFWGVILIQVKKFENGSSYGLKHLHECGKRFKTKS